MALNLPAGFLELYARLRQHFSEPQLVEISAVISWENARARFNRTFNVAAEDFSEGQFCPMPEGTLQSSAASPKPPE